MGWPTDEYLQSDELVRSALKTVNLGGLEARFEQTIDDDFDDADFVDVGEYLGREKTSPPLTGEVVILSTIPPDHVGFYQGKKKVGELYFMEDPMRVVELDSSFKQYADELRKKLGI